MKYAIYALLLSAAVTMVSGPVLIPLLHKLKFGQSERKLGPQTHLRKAGTPTMGGLMFWLGIAAGVIAGYITLALLAKDEFTVSIVNGVRLFGGLLMA